MQAFDPKTIIAPAFHDVFDDIVLNKHTHYWLKGGRGSTKSSFISLMIVLDIYESFVRFRYNQISPAELSNAICFRKVGSTIRNSLAPQIKWAIDQLGLNDFFVETSSTFEFTLKYTGQKIILTGCDDPQKIKSIKPRRGYFKNVWFEELAEFSGMEEIRTILQSVMRGISNFHCFYSYNPPLVVQNWVNFEVGVPHENRLVHHSSYLDVPKEWLGQPFFDEAEQLKKNNKRAYEHEYLGIPTGTGGTVFENIEARTITNEEIQNFDYIKQGIDWGFSVDPVAFVRLHYDSKRKIIYFIDEIYKTHMFNDELMELLKKRGYQNESIIADSEEPKSISELWREGFRIYKAEHKGAGSVSYGIKFLQRLSKIVIDQKRTPNVYKEFVLYEYEKNKDGTFRADYPDKNNHAIDATRYALEKEMRVRGIF